VTTSPFRLEGVACPPRVCHLVAPALLRDLRAALRQYGKVDDEVAEWIRAIHLESERYRADANANANGRGPVTRDTCVRAKDDTDDAAELLSAKETAIELGCSASNVRYLARHGHLTAAHMKPYLFDLEAVEHYKHSRKES
jgi:hypothetical protein